MEEQKTTITCKEDLYNTYIKNDFGELRKAYVNKCLELGIKHQDTNSNGCLEYYDLKYIGVTYSWGTEEIGQTDIDDITIPDCKQLTLDDLKTTKDATAKEKYAYELVEDMTLNEIAKAMIDGEVFYNYDGDSEYSWDGGKFISTYNSDVLATGEYYRRVSKFDMLRRMIEQDTYSDDTLLDIVEDDPQHFIKLCKEISEKFND